MSNFLNNYKIAADATMRTAVGYLDELIKLKCASDLLATGLFPNAKEITESFGAFRAVTKHCYGVKSRGDKDIVIICVGDGVGPRTSSVFAFRSAWECISVDPNMRLNKELKIKRITRVKAKIENWRYDAKGKRVVIVAVHSHAKLDDAVTAVSNAKELKVVAIPCCVPQEIHSGLFKLIAEYEDWRIVSPKRTIKVWSRD